MLLQEMISIKPFSSCDMVPRKQLFLSEMDGLNYCYSESDIFGGLPAGFYSS
jgi:hypothetical protein